MPDFLMPITALAALIAAELARRSLNRAAKLDRKLDSMSDKIDTLNSHIDDLNAELKREKRKRGVRTSLD